MSHFDLFNGDADGIFALIQLRLARPLASTLVSGVKRDIQLLANITAKAGDSVTVLDVSLESNRESLLRLLNSGAKVDYIDHHYAGEIPQHPLLQAQIQTGAAWCTSLLVDRALEHQYPSWAIAGAFGDNLDLVASNYSKKVGFDDAQIAQLKRLGHLVNYNSYGLTSSDLHFDPVDLFQRLRVYDNAFEAESSSEISILQQGYDSDMRQAQGLTPLQSSADSLVYLLPDQAWARRMSGTLANQLQRQYPTQAIALLLPVEDGYQVSVRVPVGFTLTADQFCRQFSTGGGRKLAAGINQLNCNQLELFLCTFRDKLQSRS